MPDYDDLLIPYPVTLGQILPASTSQFGVRGATSAGAFLYTSLEHLDFTTYRAIPFTEPIFSKTPDELWVQKLVRKWSEGDVTRFDTRHDSHGYIYEDDGAIEAYANSFWDYGAVDTRVIGKSPPSYWGKVNASPHASQCCLMFTAIYNDIKDGAGEPLRVRAITPIVTFVNPNWYKPGISFVRRFTPLIAKAAAISSVSDGGTVTGSAGVVYGSFPSPKITSKWKCQYLVYPPGVDWRENPDAYTGYDTLIDAPGLNNSSIYDTTQLAGPAKLIYATEGTVGGWTTDDKLDYLSVWKTLDVYVDSGVEVFPPYMHQPPYLVSGLTIPEQIQFGDVITAEPGVWGGEPAPVLVQRLWGFVHDQYPDTMYFAPGPNSGTDYDTSNLESLLASLDHIVLAYVEIISQLGETYVYRSEFAVVLPNIQEPVQEPPALVTPPYLSGGVLIGEQVQATSGVWDGIPPPQTKSWQWQINQGGQWVAAPGGSNNSVYDTLGLTTGTQVRVVQTVSNNIPPDSSAASQSVTVSGTPPFVTFPPIINGLLQVGEKLWITHARRDGVPQPVTQSLLWEAMAGEAWVPAPGANTAETYDTSKLEPFAILRVTEVIGNDSGQVSSSSRQVLISPEMRNALIKERVQGFSTGSSGTAGSPGSPAQPGRWENHTSVVCDWRTPDPGKLPPGASGVSITPQYSCRDVVERVWVPPVPAVPPTPGTPPTQAQFNVEENIGWTGSAHSIKAGPLPLVVKFKVSPGTLGAVVGISKDPPETGYASIEHAFFVSSGTYRIVESGHLLTDGKPLSLDDEVSITHLGGSVFYKVNNDLVWTSEREDDGQYDESSGDAPDESDEPGDEDVHGGEDNWFVAASMYCGWDIVYDPSIDFLGRTKGLARLALDAWGSGTVSGRAESRTMYVVGFDQDDVGAVYMRPMQVWGETLPAVRGGVEMRPMRARGYGAARGGAESAPMTISAYDGAVFADIRLRPLTAYGEGSSEADAAIVAPKIVTGTVTLWLTATAAGHTLGTGEGGAHFRPLEIYASDTQSLGVGCAVFEPMMCGGAGYQEGYLNHLGIAFFETPDVQTAAESSAMFYLVAKNELMVLVAASADRHVPESVVFEALAETIFNSSTLAGVVAADAVIVSADASGNPAPEVWVLNTSTGGSTRYEDYHFNSFAKLGDAYYGCRADGLYRLDGDTDDGAPVRAMVSFGKQDFGTTALKSTPYAYIGMSASGRMFLKVRVNDDQEYLYAARQTTEHLETQRVDMGRGIRASFVEFELWNEDGADFEVASVEFVAVPLSRRI